MRYYAIEISYPRTSESEERRIFRQFSSHKNGVYNPGALQMELDISRFDFHTPTQQGRVSLWGISPGEMQQDMVDMVGMEIRVYGGMMNGLPLSASGTSGLIIQAQILQVLGNWAGAELRMDIIITCEPFKPGAENVSSLADLNFTLVWRPQVTLAEALENCFKSAGNFTYQIDVSDRLVNAFDSSMFSGSLTQLATALHKVSRNIIKDKDYLGVRMVFRENKIVVYDAVRSSKTGELRKATRLKFQEVIGQPVWIKFGTVSAVLVMRNDLLVGDIIQLPLESRPLSLAESWSRYRDRLAFAGDFLITHVRFLGNSRNPDGNSWVVVVEALALGDIRSKK